MAGADYRLCDICTGKVFYDANLNYDDGDGAVRNAGVMIAETTLDYLGDWCVLCDDCAKTHECAIVPKNTRAPIAEGGASPEGVYARYLPKGTLMLADPGGELRYNCYEIKHNGKTHILPLIDESKATTAAIESLSRQGGDKLKEVLTPSDFGLGGLAAERAKNYANYLLRSRASEAGDWVHVPRVPTKAMIKAHRNTPLHTGKPRQI